jgi:hypothetical protein
MVEYVHFEDRRVGPKLYKIGKYSFSMIEVKHLLGALVMITATLMILQRGFLAQLGIVNFIIIFVSTIGSGFILHELAHKLVAQKL